MKAFYVSEVGGEFFVMQLPKTLWPFGPYATDGEAWRIAEKLAGLGAQRTVMPDEEANGLEHPCWLSRSDETPDSR